MPSCLVTRGVYDLVTKMIALHRTNQDITIDRLVVETAIKSYDHSMISRIITRFEKQGFVEIKYTKNLRRVIIPTDDLYMLHKLMTLTDLLLKADPKFYESAPIILKKILQYLEVSSK